MPQVSIVIVNWNTGDQLRDCLRSIPQACEAIGGDVQVMVVDNGSSDGSLEDLPDDLLNLLVLRNSSNRGFAAACNLGASSASAGLLLFLNPDVRLSKDCISRAVATMSERSAEQIGICGVQLVAQTGEPARTCARFPRPVHLWQAILGLDRLAPAIFPGYIMRTWDHKSSRVVDHVIGAFYLVRCDLFELLDGFDERFFVYLEDLDLSLRAKRHGWKCYFLAEVSAFHKGGGASDKVRATRLSYSLHSKMMFAWKHFSWISAFGITLGILAIEPWTRLIAAIARGSVSQVADTVGGYATLWRRLLSFPSGRRTTL